MPGRISADFDSDKETGLDPTAGDSRTNCGGEINRLVSEYGYSIGRNPSPPRSRTSEIKTPVLATDRRFA
jgi:hypothetical protein